MPQRTQSNTNSIAPATVRRNRGYLNANDARREFATGFRGDVHSSSIAGLIRVLALGTDHGARREWSRRDAIRVPDAMDRVDCLDRGSEVAGTNAFRNQQRTPAVLVLALPDLDPRIPVGQELNHLLPVREEPEVVKFKRESVEIKSYPEGLVPSFERITADCSTGHRLFRNDQGLPVFDASGVSSVVDEPTLGCGADFGPGDSGAMSGRISIASITSKSSGLAKTIRGCAIATDERGSGRAVCSRGGWSKRGSPSSM